MSLVRRIARPLLASVFVTSGLEQLRQPQSAAQGAEGAAAKLGELVNLDGVDPEALVRVNGGVQLGAATLLAVGRLPRTSALALAGTLVPTTLTAHPFWEQDDPAERRQQRIHFLKNLSLLGGLILAAMDTEGRPGLRWRTRHTAEHTRKAARRARREARLAAKAAGKAQEARLARAARTAQGKLSR